MDKMPEFYIKCLGNVFVKTFENICQELPSWFEHCILWTICQSHVLAFFCQSCKKV